MSPETAPGSPWHVHLKRAPWWGRLALFLVAVLAATGATARLASALATRDCDTDRYACRADVVFGSFAATVVLLVMVVGFAGAEIALTVISRRKP